MDSPYGIFWLKGTNSLLISTLWFIFCPWDTRPPKISAQKQHRAIWNICYIMTAIHMTFGLTWLVVKPA